MDYSKFPKFIAFCSAQRKFEGGDKWSPNNPANIKCVKEPWNRLAVDSINGFCVFPTVAIGIEAHENEIYSICTGNSPTYNDEGKRLFNVSNSGELTIEQMISIYAPSGDNNNPTHYANTICQWTDLNIIDTMKSLLDTIQSPIDPSNGQSSTTSNVSNNVVYVSPIQNTVVIPTKNSWLTSLLDFILSFFRK